MLGQVLWPLHYFIIHREDIRGDVTRPTRYKTFDTFIKSRLVDSNYVSSLKIPEIRCRKYRINGEDHKSHIIQLDREQEARKDQVLTEIEICILIQISKPKVNINNEAKSLKLLYEKGIFVGVSYNASIRGHQ